MSATARSWGRSRSSALSRGCRIYDTHNPRSARENPTSNEAGRPGPTLHPPALYLHNIAAMRAAWFRFSSPCNVVRSSYRTNVSQFAFICTVWLVGTGITCKLQRRFLQEFQKFTCYSQQLTIHMRCSGNRCWAAAIPTNMLSSSNFSFQCAFNSLTKFFFC
jgi:hypothetical protein